MNKAQCKSKILEMNSLERELFAETIFLIECINGCIPFTKEYSLQDSL